MEAMAFGGLAAALGLVSVLGCVGLVWQVGTWQAALIRVLRVDVVVSAPRLAALLAEVSGASSAARGG